jgi:predicted SAM-dependent methyltransferase
MVLKTANSDSARDRIYVQYGCGSTAGEGWLNFDSSPTLRIERLPLIGGLLSSAISDKSPVFPQSALYGDILRGLPLDDASVSGIYASHVLEHLSLCDFHLALKNTYRLLKPGGLFRLIVPDLLARAKIYVSAAEAKAPNAAGEFMRSTCLGTDAKPKSLLNRVKSQFGGSAHLWMWDECSMMQELAEVGFIKIRRAQFNDSSDLMFRAVEDKGRFTDEFRDIDEIAIEAVKPDDAALIYTPGIGVTSTSSAQMK